MATAQALLISTEAAIEGLLNALGDDATQEYSHGSRSWKRADFPGALDKLQAFREVLLKQVASASRSTVSFGTVARRRY